MYMADMNCEKRSRANRDSLHFVVLLLVSFTLCCPCCCMSLFQPPSATFECERDETSAHEEQDLSAIFQILLSSTESYVCLSPGRSLFLVALH